MKFDKETIFVIAICFVILVGWEPFAKKMGWIPEATPVSQVVENDKSQQSESPKNVNTSQVEKNVVKKADTALNNATKFVSEKLAPISLENENIIVELSKDYSSIKSITYKKFNESIPKNSKDDSETKKITITNDYDIDGGMLNFAIAKDDIVNCKTFASNISKNTCAISKIINLKNGDKFKLTQTFELSDNYLINSKISITNLNNEMLNITPNIWAGDLQSWAKLSQDKVRRNDYSFDYYNDGLEQVKGTAKDNKFVVPPVSINWAAVNNKFFALILKANETVYTPVVTREFLSEKEYLIAFKAQFKELNIEPKTSTSIPLSFYVGPKESKYLKAVDADCTSLVKLSWGPLNYLAKGLLWLLIKFEAICGSYGWSIVILTLLVRLLFWPATQKSNESMKKMQAIKPKVDKLREKYKDNPQLLNTKTMELYREEHVNPLGGCLPILLQIPVFFALYATLEGAFVLRQVPFLWASNLAAPDTVLSFPLGFTLFGISNFNLNPLVIAMTVTMILQQRLTPNAMEPTQQKMMALMPVVMLVFLYDLPSGLTLYWTISQIFSIGQLLVQKKLNKKKVAN